MMGPFDFRGPPCWSLPRPKPELPDFLHADSPAGVSLVASGQPTSQCPEAPQL
jgi:hypothetical protein